MNRLPVVLNRTAGRDWTIPASPPVILAPFLYAGLAEKLHTFRRDLRDEYLQPHDWPWMIGLSGMIRRIAAGLYSPAY